MMDIDIVTDLLKRVLEYSAKGDGGFTEDMALQVEKEIRNEYGGGDAYVQQPDRLTPLRKQRVQAELKNEPPEIVSRRHGLSRSTMYRLLRKG